MRRTLRNTVGLVGDLAIGGFGLALLARGLVIAGIVLLVIGGADLALRLGLLPFARGTGLTRGERADLLWGTVLTLVGLAVLVEELVVIVDGGWSGRHYVAVAIGSAALLAASGFFVRLVRSRR
jgi:hypothetical protein